MEFRDFAMVQRTELEARARWLLAEVARTGTVQCVYDEDGVIPVSFSAAPNTYIWKLLLAYRTLGGVPENDMLLRTRDNVVFLGRGASMDDKPGYSNGRLNRGGQIFDRDLGLAVEAMKKWQLEAVKTKRERLEYKIKRALDYADQLQEEYNLIQGLVSGVYDLDDQISKVETTMSEPGRANVPITDKDKFGLKIGDIVDVTMPDANERAISDNQRGGQ
jgi:hypothetical protein